MSYEKPKVGHPALQKNEVGLRRRDYEGALSTLCAGCGHDSVTAAIVQAAWEMSIPPYQFAKFSGIGCSSKTTTYFMSEAHGVNSVHGRMAAVATGASAANCDLKIIGISGDGDSLSIGLGQFMHAARRNVDMLYILENNGVYGLTKGQFSASADIGSKSKKGEANQFSPIDPAQLAITIGAPFVARSFSGDKHQLVPLIKAGLIHRGFAFIDVISPCVTFNDHESSTKSYMHIRESAHSAVNVDYIAPKDEIAVKYDKGTTQTIDLHDGSKVVFGKISEDYDPTNAIDALEHIRRTNMKGEIATGLLYINHELSDMHDYASTTTMPLVNVPFDVLNPGDDALQAFQAPLS